MASHHEWLAQTCDKQFEPLVVVDSEDGVSWRGSSWQLAEEVLRLASEVASLKAEASLLHELQEQAGATIAALRERLESFENREGACCPEDVGVEEWIATLTKQRLALAKALEAAAEEDGDISGESLSLAARIVAEADHE